MAFQGQGGLECGLSAQEMDEQRQKNVSYQYLCHLEEAKKWIEACIIEELPEAGDLEEEMRNGVYLAKLAHFFAPDIVPQRRIYDADLKRYRAMGLTFRHTDNVNHFLKALEKIKLPPIFYPETTDVYDKKNMPRLVFCLHALSLFLFRLGIAPQIQNLYGKVNFSDEVMQAMMQELSKYGCQLPQFGKIGGILANELQVDEASLHAAIIAINEAIEKRDPSEVISTLKNPSAHLQNIDMECVESYLQCLSDAKLHKKEIAINKSRDENYIPDAYDELLTQAEIQGHINQVNAFCALEKVEEAVTDGNVKALTVALASSVLSVKGFRKEFALDYLKALSTELERGQDDDFNQNSFNVSFLPTALSKTAIQNTVFLVNQEGEAQNQLKNKLYKLNENLEKGSPMETLNALRSLESKLPPVMDFAAVLYHEEMAAIRYDAQADLSLEEVEGGVRLLTAIAQVSAALDNLNAAEVWQYLSHPHAHIQSLEEAYSQEYTSSLKSARDSKISAGDSCPLLTYLDIQQVIDDVNMKCQDDNDKVKVLTAVNASLESGNIAEMMVGLQHPVLKLKSICVDDTLHYFQLLKLLRSARREMLGDTATALWLEDIEEVVGAVNRHAEESAQTALILTKLNKALVSDKDSAVMDILRLPALEHLHIRKNHQDILKHLKKNFRKKKENVSSQCPWVPYTLLDGSKVYLNLEKATYTWDKPREVVVAHKSCFMTLTDLEEAVSHVIQVEARNKKLDLLMIRLQARCRGWLVRKGLQKRRDAVVTIQAWWRMVQARRTYVMYCRALKMMEPYIIVIQRAVRKWLLRRRIVKLSSHFIKHEKQVKVIQRAWRAHKAKQELLSLTHRKNPPLSVVRKFINLLDVSASDLEEEFRLQRVKSDLVKTIRNTHLLESQVDGLDVKIGLLVHNRITLQDIIPADKENVSPSEQDPKQKRSKKGSKDTLKTGSMRSQKGLKALKKESREKLVSYQHLFYLLQTQPHYLATLIFTIPPGKTTKFIENVIFTLYNYGANDRDSYLLLKLFKTALEEEIRCKVLRLSDIVSGNPLVIKMIVSFIRKGAGQATLRDMLGPLIQKVVDDSGMQINTNPVEIYKSWINQLEMHSGQASGLPYTIDQEQALQYPEVQKRLALAITTLKEVTGAFCEQITSNRDLIPYAMLYMSRVMRASLQRRFPHIPEKEILKVVGNLIYYRYINSAIVAPDAFDIIKVSPDQKLNNAQRRNLASIAKILQFAASKKGFGDEAGHLKCLNPFIVECHEKFKTFFRQCCEVDDPEMVYNVNQYSEATLIVKPTIYITVQEICETHQLLLDHEDILAPDSSDPLHSLLSDLGERPSVSSLVGAAMDSVSGSVTVGRMEVCLALTNKFDVIETAEEKDSKDPNKLFNRTKQLLVDVVLCVDGNVVGELATGPTLPLQEENYRRIVLNRKQQEHQARQNHTSLNRSNSLLADTRVSLHEVKTRLSHNLRRLENQGTATRTDNYQSLLTAIAGDIVNQRQRRISRRAELQRLLVTASQLDEKEKFYKDQLDSYQMYLKTCLSNIAARNKNVHECSKANGEKGRSKQTVKYTAVKLKEKQVLLDVEDLPELQLKNVLFEITPLATTGIFHVQVKFMGVPMEFVEIDIQELLQLQYEGITVKKMFAKVKVNVNLLLHLLNTKFYSKKK